MGSGSGLGARVKRAQTYPRTSEPGPALFLVQILVAPSEDVFVYGWTHSRQSHGPHNTINLGAVPIKRHTAFTTMQYVPEKRLIKEEQRLRDENLDYTREPGSRTCIVRFQGPEGTAYAHSRYTLEIVVAPEYPFKKPRLFFVGEAPQHPFYAFDADDEHRKTRTTNIANTDFGILYEWWAPMVFFTDIVARIKYSLTKAGETEMAPFMCTLSPLPKSE